MNLRLLIALLIDNRT